MFQRQRRGIFIAKAKVSFAQNFRVLTEGGNTTITLNTDKVVNGKAKLVLKGVPFSTAISTDHDFLTQEIIFNNENSKSITINAIDDNLIENDEYLRNLILYIHRNPIDLNQNFETYKFSSYKAIISDLRTDIKKQLVIDSMKAVAEKQRIIDSMKIEAAKIEKEKEVVVVNNAASPSSTTTKKKGWSGAAKGAVIGAGVGAATGAIVSKKKGEGAIIGGLVGAGVGAGTGAIIDDKKKK